MNIKQLSGSPSRYTLMALLLAAGLAWQPGQVAAAENEPAAQAGEEMTDGWLKTKVAASLHTDDRLDSDDIDIDVENGVVTLQGHVDSESDLGRAPLLASEVEGVREVRNQLRLAIEKDTGARLEENADATAETGDSWIEEATETGGELLEEAGEQINDATLTVQVGTRLHTDELLDSDDIDISTENGVVTLNGYVNSHSDIERASLLAASVEGVRKVENRLDIEPRQES